jgi:predicted enzyme related to lactoylglutathione lyase
VTEISSYETGTPCWADVVSRDIERSVEFYETLFGWEGSDAPAAEGGRYVLFRRNGKEAAGAGTAPPGDEGPPRWNVYLAADDVGAAVGRVREAGGAVTYEAFDIPGAGRMAIAADPTGAVFGLWQGGEMPGARLRGGPGTINWCECQTRDAAAARAFYEQAFGYTVETMEMGAGREYLLLQVDGSPVAGLIEIEPSWGDIPPNWSVVFEVEDCDGTVARAEELGGRVLRPARTIEGVGRFAVLADPEGAAFQVIK